ncbi:putative Mu-like prophage FluMu protein gp27 [uncultured Alphaproteobacteria bacterium]|uniref:Putative Mu-like prophage FluMu protein gp27 n=1 Tax=uncultured Alphaproteobacteria bacterium TaxID=91750 RepID=A0A212KCE4_9PROT|nr:putative Mu-like prophage FluMu protein gp27 [uncultured Alphaproteobacteria bacterium]
MARRDRPSKVDQLPPEVRELIAELRQAHGWTIDQILGVLRDLASGRRPELPGALPPELTEPPTIDPDLVPSRGRLGVHIQGLSQLAEKLQRSRSIAEALVRRTGEKESRLTALNVELMHAVVTDLLLASETGALAPSDSGEEGALPVPVLQDPAKVMFLSKALDHLASAAKKDTDMVLKTRQEMAKVAASKVDKAMADARKSGEKGLSAERVAQLRRELAGMA